MAQLASLHARLGATTVYVTHDQIEAMTLGQRVAVMRDGRIQQVDTPKELYRRPTNLFVASFIGSPAMNLVEARLDGAAVEFGGHRIELRPDHLPETTSERIVLGIRPESFEDASFADPSLPQLDVDVAVLEDLGSDAHVLFQVDATPVHTEELRHEHEEETLIAGDGAVSPRVDAATRARSGARLAVDPAGFAGSIARRARTAVAASHRRWRR
jgi:multiple sugar transport system ATP-binding protein